MGCGSAVLMVLFNVILPTADMISDILLTVKLFTGIGVKKHPYFGTVSLLPPIMSWIGVTRHWIKIETKEERNKLKTLPLFLLQIYPQWRALRVLYYAIIKKDRKWVEMKKDYDGGIAHLG